MASKNAQILAAKKAAAKLKSKRGSYSPQLPPQSKVYKKVNDAAVAAKPVGWRWTDLGAKKAGKNPDSRVSANDVKKYNGKKFTVRGVEHNFIYSERRVDKSDIVRDMKFQDGGTTGAGSFKKGGATQHGRQYPTYSKDQDGQKIAKPTGYRYTDRLAKRLGVSPHAKPTAAHIEKYLGKGVYKEVRQDKSDVKPSKKYISLEQGGGTTGAGSFRTGGQTAPQSTVYQPRRDKKEVAKPVGARWTDKGAMMLGKDRHKTPNAADIEKYGNKTFKLGQDRNKVSTSHGGDGSYNYIGFEKRKDKSDLVPQNRFNDGGYMADGGYARGGVERIANTQARDYSENLIPFKGANLEGKTLDNGDYVVLSYGYYPIWWYCKKEGKWYGNATKYSQTTSKQTTQSRPTYDAVMLSKNDLSDKMMSHHATFEDGGLLDGILSNTGAASSQAVGGTAFSTASLTPHLDSVN